MAKKRIVEPKKPKCEVVVIMANGEFKGEGETVPEAFLNVPLDFMKVKYKGIVRLSQGGKTTERLFMMRPLRMMFSNKISRIHWANQISKFLK